VKSSIVKILSDEDRLASYINELEEDISKTEIIDAKLDLVLDNILNMFSNFADRRALKSTNIEAVTNLFKLKSELPMKRIQTKKMILDILTKKNEMDIKAKTADATSKLAGGASDVLRAIFMKLDEQKIHPRVFDDEVLQIECKDIIDVPIDQTIIENEDSEVTDIVSLQKKLDIEDNESLNMEEE
jgi:hypothetical protein